MSSRHFQVTRDAMLKSTFKFVNRPAGLLGVSTTAPQSWAGATTVTTVPKHRTPDSDSDRLRVHRRSCSSSRLQLPEAAAVTVPPGACQCRGRPGGWLPLAEAQAPRTPGFGRWP